MNKPFFFLPFCLFLFFANRTFSQNQFFTKKFGFSNLQNFTVLPDGNLKITADSAGQIFEKTISPSGTELSKTWLPAPTALFVFQNGKITAPGFELAPEPKIFQRFQKIEQVSRAADGGFWLGAVNQNAVPGGILDSFFVLKILPDGLLQNFTFTFSQFATVSKSTVHALISTADDGVDFFFVASATGQFSYLQNLFRSHVLSNGQLFSTEIFQKNTVAAETKIFKIASADQKFEFKIQANQNDGGGQVSRDTFFNYVFDYQSFPPILEQVSRHFIEAVSFNSPSQRESFFAKKWLPDGSRFEIKERFLKFSTDTFFVQKFGKNGDLLFEKMAILSFLPTEIIENQSGAIYLSTRKNAELVVAFPAIQDSVFKTDGWFEKYFEGEMLSVEVLADGSGYRFLGRKDLNLTGGWADKTGKLTKSVLLSQNFYPLQNDAVPTKDGGFLLSSIFSTDLKLTKLDSAGQLVWENIYPDSLVHQQVRLAAANDDGFFVSSFALDTFKHYFGTPLQWSQIYNTQLTRRIGADGQIIWEKKGASDYVFWSTVPRKMLEVLSSKNEDACFVIFESQGGTSYHSAVVVEKMTAAGRIWSKKFEKENPGGWGSFDFLTLSELPGGQLKLTGIEAKGSTSGGHPGSGWNGTHTVFDGKTGKTTQVWQDENNSSSIGTICRGQPLVETYLKNGEEIAVSFACSTYLVKRGTLALPFPKPDFTKNNGNFTGYARPNRVLRPTPDGGAILGGGLTNGNQQTGTLFLAKFDFWLNALPELAAVKIRVRKDLDFDCQTSGPFLAAVDFPIRLISDDSALPFLDWRTDSAGFVEGFLPPGRWKILSNDGILDISGGDCSAGNSFLVEAGAADTVFADLVFYRFQSQIAGQLFLDRNNNCQPGDASDSPIKNQAVRLRTAAKFYDFLTDENGKFQVAVDSGKYVVEFPNLPEGVFAGAFCQKTDTFWVKNRADTVSQVFLRVHGSGISFHILLDNNRNCSHDNPDTYIYQPILKAKELTTGEESQKNANSFLMLPGKTYEFSPADPVLPDWFCPKFEPFVLNFPPDTFINYFNKTVFVQPRAVFDTISACAGDEIFGYTMPKTGNLNLKLTDSTVLGIPFLHFWHVRGLAEPIVEISKIVDSLPLGATSDTLFLTAANGCDSTVIVHFLTKTNGFSSKNDSFSISPNPADCGFWIEINENQAGNFSKKQSWRWSISTADGHEIGRGNFVGGKFWVRREAWPAGIYFLKMENLEGRSVVGKVVFR